LYRVATLLIFLSLALSACKSKSKVVNGVDAAKLVSSVDVSNPIYKSRLIKGFYPGTGGWLWTEQQFTLALDPPVPPQATYLRLVFAVPIELIKEANPVVMTTKLNGVEIDRTEYQRDGQFQIYKQVPEKALQTSPALLEVSLDKAAKREGGGTQGLIVVSAELVVDEDKSLSRETALNLAHQGYERLLTERKQQLPVEKQHEMMKLFHDIPVWRNTWFQNVRIEKNPLDLWMMQQLIYELQPEFIVETGTWRGGSALYWAYTLNGMGLENSRVITVDIQNLNGNAAANPLWKKYVTFMKGSSTDEKIVGEIQKLVAGHKTLVVLDSDHTMKHVVNELHAYAPMVTSKSYLVVEDTHLDGVPTQKDFGPGPLAAVQTFLAEPAGKEFTQDFSREAMIMTFNPGGWLKKK
jgi:cephalosporin hydroxylase